MVMCMKKSVDFKKKNIVKMLVDERIKNDVDKIDFESNFVKDAIKEYFDEYVEPILIELNKKGIVEYRPEEIKTSNKVRRIYFKAIGYIRGTFFTADNEIYKNESKAMFHDEFELYGMDKFRQKEDDNGVFFICSNDTKLKEEFANLIKKGFTLEYKMTNFSNKYFKPLIPLAKKTNLVKNIATKNKYDDEFLDFAIETILMWLLKINYMENKDVKRIIDENVNIHYKQLSNSIYNIFVNNIPKDFFDGIFDGIYRQYIADDKNKYGHYDFNDYNKHICEIFDL